MDTFDIYNVTSNTNRNETTESATRGDNDNFLHRDIIYTFVCSAAIVANAFLIYCLVRFRRLFASRRNVIVLHWAIADTLHLLANLFTFDAIPHAYGLHRYDEYHCGAHETRAAFHAATIAFVLYMLIDRAFSERYTRKCFHATIVCIWIVAYLADVASIALCIKGTYIPYSYATVLIAFAALSLACAIYWCVTVRRAIAKEAADDAAFRVGAVTMFVVCWLPHVSTFYLSFFLASDVLYNVSKSMAIVGYMNVIVNLFLYAYLDANYGTCYAHAFRCGAEANVVKISYGAEAERDEFLYTSLKPPAARDHPKPERAFVGGGQRSNIIGTPV